MSEAAKHTPATLIFEPHNGYGAEIDGEPMPFGYISAAPGRPIFELNPVFEMPFEVMRKMAIGFAAAPEMYEALRGILSNPGGRCTADQWQAGLRALAKAEGRQP